MVKFLWFQFATLAPENGWLEYDRFLLGWPIFTGRTVSFREGKFSQPLQSFLGGEDSSRRIGAANEFRVRQLGGTFLSDLKKWIFSDAEKNETGRFTTTCSYLANG